MLKETYEFFNLFVSERTGFIKEIEELQYKPFPINLYIYNAIMPLDYEDPQNLNPMAVSGAGKTSLEALSCCIGEAIERYCGYYGHKWKRLFYGKFKQLNGKAINPEKFTLFSKRQYEKKDFPFQPFTADIEIYWVKGNNLIDGKEYYLPAQLCFLSPLPSERAKIGYASSTGLACGRSYEEAIIKAIYEVIERDTFMISWLNKFASPILEPKFLSICWLSEALDILSTSKYKVFFYLLPNDTGVAVSLSVIFNKNFESPFLSIGAAASLSLYDAVEKSLLESLHTLTFLFECEKRGIKIKFKKGKPVIKDFKDHALLYSNFDNVGGHIFLLKPEKKIEKRLIKEKNYRDLKEELEKVIYKFKRMAHNIFVIDLTPEFLRNWGFYVVKVIIPEFVDLSLGEFVFKGLSRIYELPKRLGFRRKTEEELNTALHPFP